MKGSMQCHSSPKQSVELGAAQRVFSVFTAFRCLIRHRQSSLIGISPKGYVPLLLQQERQRFPYSEARANFLWKAIASKSKWAQSQLLQGL